MKREDFTSQWINAAESGTLLTAKHDPNNLHITWEKYRSVLNHVMSGNLLEFLQSDNYAINRYQDTKYPNGSGYFELIPSPSSGFSVVGSGVSSGSITPSGSLDRLIIVSGTEQGWHVYSESSEIISGSNVSGRLTLLQTFNRS